MHPIRSQLLPLQGGLHLLGREISPAGPLPLARSLPQFCRRHGGGRLFPSPLFLFLHFDKSDHRHCWHGIFHGRVREALDDIRNHCIALPWQLHSPPIVSLARLFRPKRKFSAHLLIFPRPRVFRVLTVISPLANRYDLFCIGLLTKTLGRIYYQLLPPLNPGCACARTRAPACVITPFSLSSHF